MRKLVAAAICLLSLSLSVTTRRRCIKEARTRTGKKCWEQQLRRVDKALSRAEDTPEASWICLSQRNLILAEDKRCSMFLQFLAHAQTFDRGVRWAALELPSLCLPFWLKTLDTLREDTERNRVVLEGAFLQKGLFVHRFMLLAQHFLNAFLFSINFGIERILKSYTPKVYIFCFLNFAFVWVMSMPNISL